MGTIAYQPYIEQYITDRNEDIIKDIVIEESKSNASGSTGDEILSICAKVGKGDVYEKCVDQLDGTRKSGFDASITKSYWKAVGRGFVGTIEEFAKRKETISKGLGIATTLGGVLLGLATSKSNQGTDYKDEPFVAQKKRLTKTTKIVLISSVALAVGILSFIAYKK